MTLAAPDDYLVAMQPMLRLGVFFIEREYDEL